MNRSDILARLRPHIATALSEVEAVSNLQVQFEPLINSDVVSQYCFDTQSNTPIISLRSDWEDVDVAHEIVHMRLEVVEGFAVLAWRQGIPKTSPIESAFARVRLYVDDEVVHSDLLRQGFALHDDVLKSQLFDDMYTNATRFLNMGRPNSGDGMSHLDSAGYGVLYRSSLLVQAELVHANYASLLSDVRREKVEQFIRAFRKYRLQEAKRADEILQLFHENDVTTVAGHRRILESWMQMEGLGRFVGISTYIRSGNRYILPWP